MPDLEFKPLYFEDKLPIINPNGYTGAVTLWTKIDGEKGYRAKLEERYPDLFEEDSPLVTLTNLYGNGLPQMLANLAYNPQVERIAITGSDATGSAEALENFFREGVTPTEIGGVSMLEINGTNYPLDPSLDPSVFRYSPEIKVFKASEYESMHNFLTAPRERKATEDDRVEIEIKMPEFKDFPSDLTSHNLTADSISDAWLGVLFHIDRYGRNYELEKGPRRTLFNLDVNIKDPVFESENTLEELGFDPEELRAYQEELLNPELPDDQPYTYGNRARAHFGVDTYVEVARRLRDNPLDRHSLVSLWDTEIDINKSKDSAAPCFTDAYFLNLEGKLMMTVGFRTHNATSAWLTNMYGMRGIQEFIAKEAGIEPGPINVRSRWISIDPENAKTKAALERVKEHRKIKLDVNDPKGYFDITTDPNEGEIVAQHYSPQGVMLEEIRGTTAEEVKNELRQLDPFTTTDHAAWVGMNLAVKHYELHGKMPDL